MCCFLNLYKVFLYNNIVKLSCYRNNYMYMFKICIIYFEKELVKLYFIIFKMGVLCFIIVIILF